MENTQHYMGDVGIGDYVLYFRNSDMSNILDYKKDIWEIIEIRHDYNTGEQVEIKNIAKESSFTTDIDNLIDIKHVLDAFKLEDVISKRSIMRWGTIKDANIMFPISTPIHPAIKNINKKFITYRPDGTVSTLDGKSKAYRNLYGKVNPCTEIKLDGTTECSLPYEEETGEVKMNMMSKVVDNNVNAAKAGAVISAGNTLNKVVKNTIRGQVPRKYRKIVDSAVGDVIVANLASFAVQNFAKTNYKARVATDAMMTSAMAEVLNSFNLDAMITDVLANVNLDEILDTTGE